MLFWLDRCTSKIRVFHHCEVGFLHEVCHYEHGKDTCWWIAANRLVKVSICKCKLRSISCRESDRNGKTAFETRSFYSTEIVTDLFEKLRLLLRLTDEGVGFLELL